MRALLESRDLEVRDYASAQAFLDAGMDPDARCLLLDLHMPEMNGIELLETLRRRNIDTAAIIITGRSDNALKARAQRAGVLEFLEKPVDEDELFRSIDEAFRQNGG
ncbi:MAG: response regulator [Parvibaculum sp.]|nr:response regulator [Parvibaculum sp.]